MSVIVLIALVSAGLSLGLRATSLLVDPGAHPLDRLLLSIFAGALIVAVTLQVSVSYRVFELGLGVLVSLSPVGPYDLTKWWFRSRGRFGRWLAGSSSPPWVIAVRVVGVIAVLATLLAFV